MKCIIIETLINNQEYIKELLEPVTKSMLGQIEKEDSVYHSVIREQYKERIKSDIVNFLSNKLALDYETIVVILEEVNLEDYLNV